jgi:hypothetical protein
VSLLDLLLSAIVTLALHATALLGAVWLAERTGALKHPDWSEFAWRAALLLALVSTSLQVGRLVPDPAPPEPAAAVERVASADIANAATGAPRPSAARGPDEARVAATAGTTIRLSGAGPGDTGIASPDTGAAGTGESFSAGGSATVDAHDLPPSAAWSILLGWLAATGIAAFRLAHQAAALRRLGRQAHGGREVDRDT